MTLLESSTEGYHVHLHGKISTCHFLRLVTQLKFGRRLYPGIRNWKEMTIVSDRASIYSTPIPAALASQARGSAIVSEKETDTMEIDFSSSHGKDAATTIMSIFDIIGTIKKRRGEADKPTDLPAMKIRCDVDILQLLSTMVRALNDD
jgi:hypothetical protein